MINRRNSARSMPAAGHDGRHVRASPGRQVEKSPVRAVANRATLAAVSAQAAALVHPVDHETCYASRLVRTNTAPLGSPLQVWLELGTPLTSSERDMLSSALKSWFVIGKLGGYNSGNLQARALAYAPGLGRDWAGRRHAARLRAAHVRACPLGRQQSLPSVCSQGLWNAGMGAGRV
jgi:hypothetical protein